MTVHLNTALWVAIVVLSGHLLDIYKITVYNSTVTHDIAKVEYILSCGFSLMTILNRNNSNYFHALFATFFVVYHIIRKLIFKDHILSLGASPHNKEMFPFPCMRLIEVSTILVSFSLRKRNTSFFQHTHNSNPLLYKLALFLSVQGFMIMYRFLIY